MADRDAILEKGTKDYAPILYIIEQYKKGNCPLSSVESAIKNALDEYMRLTCLELLEYMGNNEVECMKTRVGLRFYHNGLYLTAEELFENFL